MFFLTVKKPADNRMIVVSVAYNDYINLFLRICNCRPLTGLVGPDSLPKHSSSCLNKVQD